MAGFLCPRCGTRFLDNMVTCHRCGYSLPTNPLGKIVFSCGALLGAGNVALLIASGGLRADDLANLIFGGTIGVVMGAVAGVLVFGGITFVIVRAVLGTLHGRGLIDSLATETERTQRDIAVMSRVSRAEVWFWTVGTMAILEAILIAGYLYLPPPT